MASVCRPSVLIATPSVNQARAIARRVQEAQHCESELLTSGVQVLARAQCQVYDLVILTCDLTGIDGLSLCHRLRQLPSWGDVPVMMLGTRDHPGQKYRAFYVGATEFMEMPFDGVEFIWRVRVQLRRWQAEQAPLKVLACEPHVLDAGTRTVREGERVIHLTPSEFSLAWVLAGHPNEWISVEQLLLAGLKRPINDKAIALLHTHVRNLRKKLEADPAEPRLLLQQHGAYQWKCEAIN